MGLDMYLEKHTYVGNTYKDKAEQVKIVAEGIKQERITSIVERIGYWRKANAIHYWFVQHTQDGVDDNGQDTWVHKEKLQDLLDTKKILETAIAEEGDYYYQSSW